MMLWLERVASYDTIVFEGCDGAGKTTLAAAAAERTGGTIIHSALTPPGINLLTVHHDLLDRPGRLVLDRCFLSELVYGPMYRGRSRLAYQDMALLINRVVARNGVFVYVRTSPQEIIRRLRLRDETALQENDEIAQICTRYDELFRIVDTIAEVVRIVTNHPDEDS